MYRINARPIDDNIDLASWIDEVRDRRAAAIVCLVGAVAIAAGAWIAAPRGGSHARAPRALVASSSGHVVAGANAERSTAIVFVGLVEATSAGYRPICEWSSFQPPSVAYRVLDAIVPRYLPKHIVVEYPFRFSHKLPREGTRVVVGATCTEDACFGSTWNISRADATVIAEWKRFNTSDSERPSRR